MTLKLTSLIGKGATDVQTDGPITAPVWFHYLFKVLTSVGIAFALIALTPLSAVACSFIAGPGFYLVIKLFQLRFGDGDPTHYTFIAHLGDDITDCACASVPVALAYWHLNHPIALVCLLFLYAMFRMTNRYARPGGYYAK